ncbi:MAG: HDIG domain-containing metalloprotein [Petrotogales bacterium]
MPSIPNPERCIELLRENGCSEEVINHCKAVRDIAVQIAEKANADVELVEAAALLHDIGRSKTHGIKHGIEGAKIARELNLPECIVHIIERHLGAGIPKDEAVKLGLPAKDYIPKTLEEKIIAHADNLIDNNKKHPIQKEIKKALKRGQKQLAKRLMTLHKELSDICGIDLNHL